MKTRWKVEKEQSGMRLQAFIKGQMGESVSAKQIKHAVDAGRCLLNGKPERFASRLVGSGDIVEMDGLQQKTATTTPGLRETTEILYLDEALLAYNKPSGVAADNPQLLKNLQQQFGSLILLHRLDK
jgi:23S rRNA-/tRNA-specific pseudouridylate synthase